MSIAIPWKIGLAAVFVLLAVLFTAIGAGPAE
jgi:hypothetical protein